MDFLGGFFGWVFYCQPCLELGARERFDRCEGGEDCLQAARQVGIDDAQCRIVCKEKYWLRPQCFGIHNRDLRLKISHVFPQMNIYRPRYRFYSRKNGDNKQCGLWIRIDFYRIKSADAKIKCNAGQVEADPKHYPVSNPQLQVLRYPIS